MSAKQNKTPAAIGEAGVIFGFDPTDNNRVNAVKVNANGAISVTGISGGGGGGSLTDAELRAAPIEITQTDPDLLKITQSKLS